MVELKGSDLSQWEKNFVGPTPVVSVTLHVRIPTTSEHGEHLPITSVDHSNGKLHEVGGSTVQIQVVRVRGERAAREQGREVIKGDAH